MDYVVSAFMRSHVKTVPPTMTLAELERRFVSDKVSGFAVMEGGVLIGVVSKTDVLNAIKPQFSITRLIYDHDGANNESVGDEVVAPFNVAKTLGDVAEHITVADLMTHKAVTVSSNDHLHDAADLMYEHQLHRIFVVDDGKLVGVITPFDFVRLYSQNKIKPGASAPDRDF